VGRVATRENLELAGFQFEDHRACDTHFLARSGPGFFRETTDHRFGLAQLYVALKGVLGLNRLRRSVWDNFALVDPSGQLVEAHTLATEAAFEYG
jgi:hypothetical protein